MLTSLLLVGLLANSSVECNDDHPESDKVTLYATWGILAGDAALIACNTVGCAAFGALMLFNPMPGTALVSVLVVWGTVVNLIVLSGLFYAGVLSIWYQQKQMAHTCPEPPPSANSITMNY